MPQSLIVFAVVFGFGFCFFAKPFDVGFGLLNCLICIFANFGNAFFRTLWFNVDDKALLIRRADNPPGRKGRTSESASDNSNGDEEATHYVYLK
jgi:hypothetical protein